MSRMNWELFKKLPRERKVLHLVAQILNPNDVFVDAAGQLNCTPQRVYQAIFGDVIRAAQTETLTTLLRDAGFLRSNGKRGLGAAWYLTLPEVPQKESGNTPLTIEKLAQEQLEAAAEAEDESDARVHRAVATTLVGLADPKEIRGVMEIFQTLVDYL